MFDYTFSSLQQMKQPLSDVIIGTGLLTLNISAHENWC